MHHLQAIYRWVLHPLRNYSSAEVEALKYCKKCLEQAILYYMQLQLSLQSFAH